MHDDPLDLEALAVVDAVVITPGAVDLAVGGHLRAPAALQTFDDLLHFLRLVLGRHHHGVRRLDHHQSAQADTGHQPPVGDGQRVARVVHHHVALQDIALLVLVADAPQGVPGADVGPAGGKRNHHRPPRAVGVCAGHLLHHGVVDRVGGTGGERFLVHAQEIAVLLRGGDRPAAGLQNVGTVPADFCQPGGRLHDEDAAVPEVLARVDVSLRRRLVRFLHEAIEDEGMTMGQARHRDAAPDVTVAGLGRSRRDAEGDQRALLRQPGGAAQRRAKGAAVADDMVRRHHRQHRIAPLGAGVERGQGEGGRRVAPDRFEDDGLRRLPRQAQLLGDDEAVFLVRNDDRRQFVEAIFARFGVPAQHRVLQHRMLAAQGEQLLRMLLARQRPQARAGAAGKNDGLDQHGSASRDKAIGQDDGLAPR